MYASVTLALICSILFLVQGLVPGFTESLALVSSDAFQRPWILVTSIFIHGGVVHLLNNMFALVIFGMILEHIIGRRKFLWIFFFSGLLASLGCVFLYDNAFGASGAIFGILGTLAVLRPRMQVWVAYFPLPMVVAAFVWVVVDFVRLFVPSGVASLAHLIGLFFGVGVGFYLRRDYIEHRPEPFFVSDSTIEAWEEKWMK